jgi:hypothetical protein
MMSRRTTTSKWVLTAGIALAMGHCWAFNSGSTGADGAFNPESSQSVQLPPSGVFNYTSVNIPAGVTITYEKNATNTPVTILASGDVTIAGTIDVSAKPPAEAGNLSGPGRAGPGGFDGGRGGQSGGDASNWVNGLTGANIGRAGQGPGGGTPGNVNKTTPWGLSIAPGGGGAFGAALPAPGGNCPTTPGAIYGNIGLLPLIGGSGGGGGAGGSVLPGSGGGGGGGALLIAASGTINVAGAVLANGGTPVPSTVNGRGTPGGGGSGGAIRMVATTISGNGTISALGSSVSGGLDYVTAGTGYYLCVGRDNGSADGGVGRIRLESETLTRTAATTPLYVGGVPNVLSVPGLPTLSIVSIGGVAVPASPTGVGDVVLPAELPNPVTVVFSTKGVTVGSSIKLSALPASGPAIKATSAATTGSTENATASVEINLPGGQSVLQASVTYTVVAALGDAMSTFAQGERVEKVRLSATLGGASTATLITVSGKEYEVPAEILGRFVG